MAGKWHPGEKALYGADIPVLIHNTVNGGAFYKIEATEPTPLFTGFRIVNESSLFDPITGLLR